MEIKIGEIYMNKTWRFLLPCLRGHGDTFVRKFNPLFKLAVGIHDTLTNGAKISEGRSIYIMCDKITQGKYFEEFLEWIKFQEYYVADYCPDSEILTSRKHMFIIKIPEIFNDAYDNFLQGNYSMMYLDSEVNLLFSSSTKKKEYNILKRDSSIIEEYVAEVNKEFKLTGNDVPTAEDFKYAELEFPLKKVEEIFNYDEAKEDGVFFNEKLDKKWEN